MKIKDNKVTINAKCLPTSREIIKTSEYSYGEGIDFFANILNDKKERTETFLKLIDGELHELNLKLEKIKMEILAMEMLQNKLLKERISHNKRHINSDHIFNEEALDLNNDNGSYAPSSIQDEKINESVNTILNIAQRFQCDPLEVDRFTGTKTINFHANKCKISVYELKKYLNLNK
ncbi:hypothetical protein [Methanobacterium alcaliphilum]|uniref:hypothetical protein n=1 Tax=Methanobacterium alcaliphilum TaxID=392018 RepID=UPI00200A270D|nr:hypothetical protein [Methanobacterium alcaliphilum]MCK9150518.1 hypothetical protein [Methanobacterium alcaliphilum]